MNEHVKAHRADNSDDVNLAIQTLMETLKPTPSKREAYIALVGRVLSAPTALPPSRMKIKRGVR
jgi:hypothetical protein